MSPGQIVRYHSLHEGVYDSSSPEFDLRLLAPITPTSASALLPNQQFLPDTSYDNLERPKALYPGELPPPRKKHPFAKGFEAPKWANILTHIALCITAYPLLLLVTLIAREKSLFWTRFIVGLGCGVVGFCLGLSLLRQAREHLEAATWATIIQQSRVNNSPGIKLRDLAANTNDPVSALSALRLIWDRAMYHGTSRSARKHYDTRPWTLFIVFFLFLVVMAGSLAFVLGRLVDITTTTKNQREDYEEVAIMADNSASDISRATTLIPVFGNFALTWTLSPFSRNGGLPAAVSFDWGNDTVYFSETILPQLLPNGSGFGTFISEGTDSSLEVDKSAVISDLSKEVDVGSVLRYPKWGTRIHCSKIPTPEVNIVPRTINDFTYLYTPRSVLASLFSSFNKEYPSLPPFNASTVLRANDTLPPGLNLDDMAIGVPFFDNGVGHSFYNLPVSMGNDGKGWVSIEQVLIRLNTTYTPNGTFPVRSISSVPDINGDPTWIGYDAAVCLQLFEPWIVEVYNSTTGVPSSLRIVEPGNEIRSQSTEKLEEKMIGRPVVDIEVKRQLNSSQLADVYICAHTNSINQAIKDNGRDAFYVTSPTVISFTDGKSATGYTELSEKAFARARGLADANNVLPYFSGTGKSLARRYRDRVLSSASINPVYMGVYLALVLIVGLVAGFFVPKLPLNVPHRGFEVYSWIAAFHAEELIGVGRAGGSWNTNMTQYLEVGEIAERMGDLKFRYVR